MSKAFISLVIVLTLLCCLRSARVIRNSDYSQAFRNEDVAIFWIILGASVNAVALLALAIFG
jgi:hypothetical protein